MKLTSGPLSRNSAAILERHEIAHTRVIAASIPTRAREEGGSAVKEAIKVIISAWSVAFIALAIFGAPYIRDRTGAYAIIFFTAVTGCGWLWYRSDNKPGSATESKPEVEEDHHGR